MEWILAVLSARLHEMQTTQAPFRKGIILYLIFIVVCMVVPEEIGPSRVWAFRFISPSNGEVVEAGDSLKIRIDPGEGPPLFGVLLMVSRGVSPSKLDSLPPYEWSIQVPKTYIGPLTFWAVARRYYPVPNPPRAAVTINVIHPIYHSSRTDLFREGKAWKDWSGTDVCRNLPWSMACRQRR